MVVCLPPNDGVLSTPEWLRSRHNSLATSSFEKSIVIEEQNAWKVLHLKPKMPAAGWQPVARGAVDLVMLESMISKPWNTVTVQVSSF
jgi:hypothetical protein